MRLGRPLMRDPSGFMENSSFLWSYGQDVNTGNTAEGTGASISSDLPPSPYIKKHALKGKGCLASCSLDEKDAKSCRVALGGGNAVGPAASTWFHLDALGK